MRQLSITLRPRDEPLHPVGRRLVDAESVGRERVHYLHRLEDGTCVLLYQLRGDAERVAEVLAEPTDVVAWEARSAGEWIHLLLRFNPTDTADRLLDAVDSHPVALVFPLRCTADGGFRVTAVGPEAALDSATSQLPPTIRVDVHCVCAYRPERHQLGVGLTERQQEILEAAVAAGYYEVPKGATCADVADRLDVARATVGEHLQKIEAQVLSAMV